MKTWSVQTQGLDGAWFFRAGDMLASDARYWFAKYCDMDPFYSMRLCNGGTVVSIKIVTKGNVQ